jgi:hypothetical protein
MIPSKSSRRLSLKKYAPRHSASGAPQSLKVHQSDAVCAAIASIAAGFATQEINAPVVEIHCHLNCVLMNHAVL